MPPFTTEADFFVGVDLDYKDSNNLYRYPPKQAVQSALWAAAPSPVVNDRWV